MRTIRIACRSICGLYWAFLTVLLLAPNPIAFLGLKRMRAFPFGDFGVHFTAFTLLTLLVRGSGWPKGPVGAILLLLAYGAATESLQALVPPRTVELTDFLANLLGIAVGSAVYWSLCRISRTRCARSRTCRDDSIPAPPGDRVVLE